MLYQYSSGGRSSLISCLYPLTDVAVVLYIDVIRILIEHAHLIGRVPQCISDSVHSIASLTEARPGGMTHKGRGRGLRKRESISGILIHKLNKWRGRGSQNTTPNKSDDSGTVHHM